MTLSTINLDIVLVFFVYGLAFFSMGIALTMEAGRAPRLAERRELRPLALFGLIHGAHEWLEIILLQGVWLGQPFPEQISWLRVVMLVVSFVFLAIFGMVVLHRQKRMTILFVSFGIGWLAVYLGLILFGLRLYPENWIGRADALARYLWAVPAGILASLALQVRAKQARTENRPIIARCFQWAALGFGLYGLTQIFVSRTDLFPARYLNAELFLSLFGFPVQTISATMAVLVTINLLRAIQVVDREREAQLLTAQQARLEALEQVQRELLAREAMRRELLRHTVIAQEEERGRIARELHDETAQALTALTLNLATLRHSLPKHQNTLELINRLQDLCQQMAKSLYRIVHDLRPAQLDDLGLVATLEYLADEARQRLGLEVVLSVSGTRRRLDPLIETVIFRVAQEALTNVGRHAEIRQASASLLFEAHRVVLRIRDYGRGFDVNQTLAPPRGWGLVGMRERAESIGGRLHLLSSPGAGTLVEVSVPLAEENPHETHSTDGSG